MTPLSVYDHSDQPRRTESAGEGPPQLLKIALRHVAAHTDFSRPYTIPGIAKGTKKLIPDHPEFAEIDLSIFVFSFVMPAMNLCHAQQLSEYTYAVVQVGMLKCEVHRNYCKPAADHIGRRSEDYGNKQTRACQQRCTDRVPTLAIEPVQSFGAVMQGMQAP